MKKLIAALYLILSYDESFCQRKISSPLSDVKNEVASIDAYVKQVNINPKLQQIYVFDSPEFKQFGIYTKKEYGVSNYQTPWKVLKIVKTNQNVNTSYFKDSHLVYINDISSVHGNYSNIKDLYFRNDSVIYSTHKICEEQILEIKSSYDGAREGGSYTLIINKDSIKYVFGNKIITDNSSSYWNKLTSLINLTDFDKIKTTGFESYIDGHDLSYVITTDKRVHSFVNAPYNDPELKKMATFFEQINLLIPTQKR